MNDLIFSIVGAAALGITFLVGLSLFRRFLIICKPNEVLIFSGGRRTAVDGSEVGYRVVFGGWTLRSPLERVQGMSLETMALDLHVTNAYSKGGIPLNLHAIANIKVSSDPVIVMNAIERFLGRDPAEIRRGAKESLEAHLRGVLSTLTPEEVNDDRLKFANALVEEADDDFEKLGLHLDTLKVLNVYDDVKYLDSIGRERIANVLMVADMAESQAKSEAEQAEAGFRQGAQIAVEQAEGRILQKQNELRKLKADFEARAKAEEETTIQMAAEARSNAERDLQDIRQKLEQTRLMAEVVLPARAEQQAAGLRARGAAAEIAENGAALSGVLALMTDTWLKAGKDAKDIFLLQQLEHILGTVAAKVNGIQVGEVRLVDNGDGKALAAYVAGYPAMVNAVLDEIRKGTGVDIPALLLPTASETN